MARRSHLLWNAGRTPRRARPRGPRSPCWSRWPPGAGWRAGIRRPGPRAHARAGHARCDRRWARRASTSPSDYGDAASLAHALNAVGSAPWLAEPDRAVELLTAQPRRGPPARGRPGRRRGAVQPRLRRRRDPPLRPGADRWLRETLTWCDRARPGRLRAATPGRGRPGARSNRAGGPRPPPTATGGRRRAPRSTCRRRIVALTVLGRLRARRGDPDAADAAGRGVGAGRADRRPAAALAGRGRPGRGRLAGRRAGRSRRWSATPTGWRSRLEHGWAIGELGYWLRRPGRDVDPRPRLAARGRCRSPATGAGARRRLAASWAAPTRRRWRAGRRRRRRRAAGGAARAAAARRVAGRRAGRAAAARARSAQAAPPAAAGHPGQPGAAHRTRSSTCSRCSPTGCATPTSPPGCTSRPRPSTTTCRRSWPSSVSAPGRRRPAGRATRGPKMGSDRGRTGEPLPIPRRRGGGRVRRRR